MERLRVFISHHRLAITLMALSVVGFTILWFSTPWGIGVGYDSIFYLSAADNLLNGLGLSRLDGYGNIIPLTHFPPLYPLTIAGVSLISGLDSDIAARLLAAFYFGLLVGIVGWLAYRYTRSFLASLMGAALILVSPILLDLSFMAMSELPYLVLMLLGIHFLNLRILNGRKIELFIAAALAGLAYLTRYVGITLVALGGLSLLVFQPRTWGQKLKDVVTFGVISLLPVMAFYVRNGLLTGSLTNRIIAFHPPTTNQIRQGLASVTAWLLPARIDSTLRLIALGLYLLVIMALILIYYLDDREESASQQNTKEGMQFVVLLAIDAAIYVIMVLASLTFFDASTRLNDRILSPLYLVGILSGLVVVWNSALFEQHRLVRIGVFTLGIVFIGMNLMRGFDVANEMRQEGRGFSGRDWRNSETIAAIEQLPPGTLMFSNEAAAIYYLTENPSNWIPENYDPVKGKVDEKYDQRITAMRTDIIEQDGALVVFNSIQDHDVYAPVEVLSEGLTLWKKGADGVIYINP